MLFLLEMDSNLRFTPQLMPSRGWTVKDIVKASSNVRHWVKISSQDLLISVWFFSHNNMWLYAMAKERNVELYSSLAMLWANLQQTQQWWWWEERAVECEFGADKARRPPIRGNSNSAASLFDEGCTLPPPLPPALPLPLPPLGALHYTIPHTLLPNPRCHHPATPPGALYLGKSLSS